MPFVKDFPAADFFFVTVKAKKQEDLTLWLLQTTKAEGHSFKLKALQDVMNKHFEKDSLKKVRCIKWVVVVPTAYTTKQSVGGDWKNGEEKVPAEQYLFRWDTKK